jgi:hypothetical protein
LQWRWERGSSTPWDAEALAPARKFSRSVSLVAEGFARRSKRLIHPGALTGAESISKTWNLPMPSRSFFASAYSGDSQKRWAAARSGHSDTSALGLSHQPFSRNSPPAPFTRGFNGSTQHTRRTSLPVINSPESSWAVHSVCGPPHSAGSDGCSTGPSPSGSTASAGRW